MKIVAISDQHGFLPEIPTCDLLLIAGDICPVSSHDPSFQAVWLDTNFRTWLQDVPAKHVVGVAGNHDFVFMTHPEKVPKDLRWHYLECSSVELEGLKIWGSPWQNWFYDWAFNAPRVNGEQWLGEKIYSHMPADTDIVVTHGPPNGDVHISHLLPHGPIHGDYDKTVAWNGNPPEHVGSIALSKKLDSVQPMLVVTGHIHSGRTAGKRKVLWHIDPMYSETTTGIIANVSIVNERYKNVYPPVEFIITDQGVK